MTHQAHSPLHPVSSGCRFCNPHPQYAYVAEGDQEAGGVPGPPGSPGADGQDGAQGPQGVQGAPGSPGVAGDTGPQGPQGSQGIQGPQGDTGAQGSAGAAGAAGVQGSPGNNAPSYQLLSNGATAMAFATAATSKVTPTAAATYTTTVPAAGTVCHLVILTTGTTSRTITFGSGFKPVGTLATGTTSGRVFVVHWISDGTNLYEAGRTAAMVA